jgi:hypothetical protein
MADFVQNSETKNAVYKLTSPIPDVATRGKELFFDSVKAKPSHDVNIYA